MDIPGRISSLDRENMLEKLLTFPSQCSEANAVKPGNFSGYKPEKILFCGMGGSAIGADSIAAISAGHSKIPIFVNRDYNIPAWADERTMIITASYSGNTEETLSCLQEGLKSKSKIICISSNGAMESFAVKHNIPFIKIPGGYPPRCAFGHLFFPCYNVLSGMEIMPPLPGEIIGKIESWVKSFKPDSDSNKAFKIASVLHGKVPLLYAEQPFLPAAVRWKTQIAENSKSFAFVNTLPEMNHNEIMAWRHPEWFIEKTVPVFLESGTEHPRNKLRIRITEKIIAEKQPGLLSVCANEESFASALLYFIVLGDWVSFYLAMFNNTDPTEINEISLLKKELGGL